MGENHSSVVVLRIRPKFCRMGVRDNHTKYEPETQQWRPETGVDAALWEPPEVDLTWLLRRPFSFDPPLTYRDEC